MIFSSPDRIVNVSDGSGKGERTKTELYVNMYINCNLYKIKLAYIAMVHGRILGMVSKCN